MNILWIIKRWTMGQDVIGQQYGRYYHLPVELARLGHDVTVLALDYRGRGAETHTHSGVTWQSAGGVLSGAVACARTATALLRNKNFDWIIGATDMHFCMLARWLGNRCRVRVCQDIYDDFETFASGRLLRMSPFFYRALDRSEKVIAFHDTLGRYLQKQAPRTSHHVVPNAVDPALFRQRNRDECRKKTRLPLHVPIIGYFGAIDSQRELNILCSALERVKKTVPEAVLVVAGRLGKHVRVTASDCIFRGFLPHDEMPVYISACNAAVILCYKKLQHLTHSLPLKSIEYCACRVPFVVPNTGALPQEAHISPDMLYVPHDAADLARALLRQLERAQPEFPQALSWQEAGEEFSQILEQGAALQPAQDPTP